MTWLKRVAPVATAVTIAFSGIGGSALAASKPTHWTAAKCASYKASFVKRHKHPTKAQLAAGNKVLKRHGCKIKA